MTEMQRRGHGPRGDHGGYHPSLIMSRGTMPTLPSSPIGPAIGHLADLAENAVGDRRGLLAVLARVTDPRHRRGMRHQLAVPSESTFRRTLQRLDADASDKMAGRWAARRTAQLVGEWTPSPRP